ncbi:MAG: guanine deaminase [Deltaproteobacteria bacterium]|nr:MAG: guanine deaminase [Deltaproteobacteria bacterium]
MPSYRARLLTPDPDAGSGAVRYLDDALIRTADGRFETVAPYRGEIVDHDLRPSILLPGFIDSHVHLPQTRIVGSASGPLLEWLDQSTFPEEQRFADTAHAAVVSRAFAAALAAAGTTLSFVYTSVHPSAAEQAAQALSERGLRAIVGPVLMDEHSPAPLCLPADRALPALEALAERWHGHDDRIEIAVIPRFALSCSAELMRRAGELARRRGLWVSTHLAENPAECAAAEARFEARDYLSIYEDLGLVHEKSLYAHCIHLSDAAWDRFAEAGAIVAHCPDSNDFLGSGGMPIRAVLDRGIGLTLGTDIAAGRSFRVPTIASRAFDNALRQGHSVSPGTLLWWATRTAALALHRPDLGAVHPGLQADFVLLDVPEWVESADEALAWTFFYADAPPPRGTWVRGERVWDRDAHRAAGGLFPWDEVGR